MRSDSSPSVRLSLLLACTLALGACGGGGPTCGPGTREAGGTCIADTDGGVPAPDASPEPDGGLSWPDDVHPLDGIGDEGTAATYAALDPVVEGADIVGIGTPRYTTGGADRIAHRVVRHLVEELGFRFVAIHAPWEEWEGIEREMCDEGGAEAALTDDPWGIWASEETAAMLDWICEWNAAHPDARVRVAGFDHQGVPAHAAALRALLAEHATAEQATALSSGFATCTNSMGPPARYPVAMTREAHEACLSGLDAVSAWIDGHLDALGADAAATARMRVIGMRQLELYYWHADATIATGNEPDASLRANDYALGLALTMLAQRARLAPGVRTAVVAHMAHVVENGPAFYPALAGSMGAFVIELGEGARYVALATISASLSANWPGTDVGTTRYDEGPTLERELRDLNVGQALIDLHPTGATRRLIDADERVAMYGATDLDPRAGFHGLLYLDSSAPITALLW